MASEYYSGYGERPAGKCRRNWALWLLDGVMTALSLVVAVTLVLTYFVPHVNPSRVWFFPVLGLAAPITYVAAVILMLYWIIRWRWLRAGVMIVIVAVGFFKVSLFWRPDIRRVYEEAEGSDRGTFKVMTYNVRSFYGENGHSSVEDILRLIDEQDPDIICLQEFNARLAARSEEFSLLEETSPNTASSRIRPARRRSAASSNACVRTASCAPPRSTASPGWSGRPARGASSAAISTIRPCLTSIGRWPGARAMPSGSAVRAIRTPSGAFSTRCASTTC